MKYTHLIIKELVQGHGRNLDHISTFSKVDEASGVIDLVSEISKGDSVKIKSILRITSEGHVIPVDIEYKGGRLQLVVK